MTIVFDPSASIGAVKSVRAHDALVVTLTERVVLAANDLVASGGALGTPTLTVCPAREGPPPPIAAERLLCYVFPKRRRDEILGDLAEDYWTTLLPKFGPRDAQRMYWARFAREIAATVPRSIWAAILGSIGWLWQRFGS